MVNSTCFMLKPWLNHHVPWLSSPTSCSHFLTTVQRCWKITVLGGCYPYGLEQSRIDWVGSVPLLIHFLYLISRKTQCLAPKVNRSNTKPGFRVFFGGVLYCSIPTHNRQVPLSSPGSVLVHRLGLLLTAMRHFRPHLPHILQDLSEFRWHFSWNLWNQSSPHRSGTKNDPTKGMGEQIINTGEFEAQKLPYNLVLFEHPVEWMLANEIIYLLVISHRYGKQALFVDKSFTFIYQLVILHSYIGLLEADTSKHPKWPCHNILSPLDLSLNEPTETLQKKHKLTTGWGPIVC